MVQCLVFGPPDAGKTALLEGLARQPHSSAATASSAHSAHTTITTACGRVEGGPRVISAAVLRPDCDRQYVLQRMQLLSLSPDKAIG